MKKTNMKAQIKAIRSGLSMILTLVLLMNASKPLVAKAESPSDVAGSVNGIQAEVVSNDEASAVETAASAKHEIVQDVLLEVCTERGYGEDCAKHLLGMLWKESNNIATAVGDHGRARGYFQIWYKLHKITLECAEDLRCSAEWTLKYMERKGYPKYPNYAIQCHNGCGTPVSPRPSAVPPAC